MLGLRLLSYQETIEIWGDVDCQNCPSGKGITLKNTQPFLKSSYELHVTLQSSFYTGNDFKICNFIEKGIGIESEKVCKQVRDQIVWKQVEDTAQGLLEIGSKF